jgi:tRNA (guanine37-N1)-methyltransferase
MTTLEDQVPSEFRDFVKSNNLEVIPYTLKVDISNYTTEQALKKVLPEDVEAPSGFEVIGHIAHLNLRDSHLPYKHMIGQIILEVHDGNNIYTCNSTNTEKSIP